MIFKNSFLENSFFNLVASICNKSFVFFVSFFGAYQLTSEAHGALSVLLFLVSVMSGVLTQSIQVSANRILSVNKGFLDSRAISGCVNLIVYSFFIWCIACAAILYDVEAASEFLTTNRSSDKELYLILVLVPFNIVVGVIGGVLQGQGKFKYIAMSNITPILVSTPISVLLILEYEIFGAVLGVLIHTVLTALAHVLAFSLTNPEARLTSLKTEGAHTANKVFLPLFITSMFVSPAYWYATKLLAESTSGFSQVSLFALVWQFGLIITQVIIALGGVIMPRIAQDDVTLEKNLSNYIPTLLAAFLIISPALLLLKVFGSYILSNFEEGDYMLTAQLISVALYITAFKSGIARVIALKGKGAVSILSNAFWLLVFFIVLHWENNLTAASLSMCIVLAHIISLIVFLPIFCFNGVFSLSVIFSTQVVSITVLFVIGVLLSMVSSSVILNTLFAVLLVFFGLLIIYQEFKSVEKS